MLNYVRTCGQVFVVSLVINITISISIGHTGEPRISEPIRPLVQTFELDSDKVALGRKLFHDPQLSKDNTISCASCHNLKAGGADPRVVSIGVDGKSGLVNSPTVYNSALNSSQFWDGRAKSLEDQIDGPLQTEFEMGNLWPEVVSRLYKDDDYTDQFKKLYDGKINRENIKNAIAEFERSLITTGSPFDQWLEGNDNAISKEAEKGYQLFKHYGCISCHQGQNVGGNLFQVFGVINSYFQSRGNITDADMGRLNITGNPEDRHAFKVPSLRMAIYTAPYLHDGSAKTLRDAVDVMFKFQLGREAPDADKDAIVEFITTLAGKHEELN